MLAPGSSATGPEIVTQESLLLGAADRVSRIRHGRLALQIHLSRLRPQNRQEGHVRIALRMLEPMINAYRGQMFLLGNSDIVFMLNEPNYTDVENMVFKLRALFSKDPLTFADSGDGVDNFCTWFELSELAGFEEFMAMARAADAAARKRLREKATATDAPAPLDPKGLQTVLDRLSKLDISPVVHRQAAIMITENARAQVMFQEFSVSVADLQRALRTNLNIFANRWLFQHLSQTLDQRMIGALRSMKLKAPPPVYSLNMNISTLRSKEFAELEKQIAGTAGLSVELQVLDILADSKGYTAIRDEFRQKGHILVIDGLSGLSLQFMDMRQFKADFYKITWSPEMADRDHSATLAAALAPLGEEKVILARCDSEASIQWGLNHGVQRFQGRYVDAMLAAYTMGVCDKSSACTLGQCIARHGFITGPTRAECGNLTMLDTGPIMRAPRRGGGPQKSEQETDSPQSGESAS